MKAFVALCLLIAYPSGCAKIGATQRENDVDSQGTIKSNAGVTEPFAPKEHPSPSRENNNERANQDTVSKPEPSSSPNQRDNSQFRQRRDREDRHHSMTKEEILARIAPRLSRSGADLPVTYGSDGETVIDLKGRFSHVSLAKRMPDGTIRYTCVDNIKSAKAWLYSSERSAKQR